MGTYKVIQDIEAEDKLLGPFSLRQFIYAIIVLVSLFVGFKMITTSGPIKYFTIILVPHTVFFAVLAAPFGHDQSNEIWLLAKVRFFFKPRKRIWDQTGMKDLVTITVPKKIEKQLTKDFSRDEARNRLQALANTLDTRGWAVKNVNMNMFNQPTPQIPVYNNMVSPTDRLVNVGTEDPIIAVEDIATPYDDLDSEVAKSFTEHIAKTKAMQREQVSHLMHIPTSEELAAEAENDNIDWFTQSQSEQQPPLTTKETTKEQPKPKTLNNQRGHEEIPDSSVKTPAKTVILDSAISNDLSVGTIQHRAVKKDKDDGEVVISLR